MAIWVTAAFLAGPDDDDNASEEQLRYQCAVMKPKPTFKHVYSGFFIFLLCSNLVIFFWIMVVSRNTGCLSSSAVVSRPPKTKIAKKEKDMAKVERIFAEAFRVY